MRYLTILLASMVLAGCALAPTSGSDKSTLIRVVGEGKDRDEAMRNGFDQAIERVSGAVILSNRESRNDAMVKEETGNYSAGYVDKYEIISIDRFGNKSMVTMDVWIKSSQLAHHKLGSSKSSVNVDGEQMTTQYSTYIGNKYNADKVLSMLLDDFPSKALTITQEPAIIKGTGNRQAIVTIPVRIRWKYEYLVSLNEMLSKIEDGPETFDLSCLCFRSRERVIVISRKPDSVFGKQDKYHLRDQLLARQIASRIDLARGLDIEITMYDSNNAVVSSQCISPSTSFGYKPTTGTYVIDGNAEYKGNIEFTFTPKDRFFDALKASKRIEATISSKNQC